MAKKNYPHIDDTSFPDLSTVDVYKYENEFDYNQYQDTVKIKLLNVPWCGDYDNVVYFESKGERDKWFDEQVNAQNSPVREMSTMFRLYNDGNFKVELPIDECMKYNYVMIDYGKLPHENKTTNTRIYYFINEVKQSSVNATDLYVSVDYWNTFIYDTNITYVNLLRGHAPMASTKISDYLSNPIENSEYLLTPDVNFGELQRVASSKQTILNDANDLFLCFATNGDVDGAWGNTTKTRAMYNSQSLSNTQVVGCDLQSWSTFRNNVETQLPQFLATVKAMFIVPKKLLTVGSSFTLCGVTFYHFSQKTNKKMDSFKFTKQAFGYDNKYANIAKLYTFPYAVIEVNDFDGNITHIKVEECGSELGMYVVTNLMYPFINTEAYITGIGGGNVSNLNFFQSSDNTFTIGGRDYNFGATWNIPLFGVQLTADNDWTLNGKIGADASLTSGNASAATSKTNSDASAATSKTNADASALTSKNNADDSSDNSNVMLVNSVDNSLENMEIQNDAASLSCGKQNLVAWNDGAADLLMTQLAFNVKLDQAITTNITQSVSEIATSTAVGAVGGGAVGAAGGALTGVVRSVSNAANSAIILSSDSEMNDGNQAYIRGKLKRHFGDAGFISGTDDGLVRELTNLNINTTRSISNNNAKTEKTNSSLLKDLTKNNAQRNYNTAIANNNRSYNQAIANNQRSYDQAITNNQRSYDASHNQTLLSNHPEFGAGGGVVDKPMGIRYNVITQSKNAIRQAAEQFLRYGYMINMEWKVDTFNVMSEFSYWQCDVVYCNDKGVYEGAQNNIKEILNRGVTVWRDPKKIGVTSVYSNEVI